MIPGVSSGPGDEIARAFLSAVFRAMRSNCTCDPCRILRAAADKMEAGLLGPPPP